MNKTRILALVTMTAAMLAAGCSTTMTPDQKKVTGQVVGGVTGAAVGSLFGGGTGRIVATGAGAVLGTVVGGKVAESQ